MRELHTINTSWLPSKGVVYPKNIEIAVTPMSIRDRKLLEGATQAEYYRTLLEGITINGDLNKEDLIFHDVNFLDLIRRIYTFESKKKITISNYVCPYCKKKDIKVSFDFTDLEFEDFNSDIFGKVETLTNEDGEEVKHTIPGKPYTFSDGLTVYARPITVGNYIEMAKEYMTNFSEEGKQEQFADLYLGLISYLIVGVKDHEYKTPEDRRIFIFDYISQLFKDQDAKLLEQMEEDTSIILKPITMKCPKCSNDLEVYVSPSMTFQQ